MSIVSVSFALLFHKTFFFAKSSTFGGKGYIVADGTYNSRILICCYFYWSLNSIISKEKRADRPCLFIMYSDVGLIQFACM